MGGTDDPSNLIYLTVEEHAQAHKKLWEEHGRWQDELAWKALSGQIGKEEITRHKQRMAHLGKTLSEEHKKKIGLSGKGRIPWNKGKSYTEERKCAISRKTKGSNNGMFGKQHSEETRKKISESMKRVRGN
jgi:hypothetical protein